MRPTVQERRENKEDTFDWLICAYVHKSYPKGK